MSLPSTFEGSAAVLQIAQGIWRNLKLENIEWYEGNIDSTLYNIYGESLIANRKSISDFAYIDANHTYDATLRYTDYLLPRMTEKGIIAIDDIHYSEDMERAWTKLKQDPHVTTSMDLYHMGLLFVDPHYLKRHYKIRI